MGFLRRGSFGYTINKGLGSGYVSVSDKPDAQSVADFLKQGEYELDVAGTKFKAEIHLKPVFDPAKSKMQLNEK